MKLTILAAASLLLASLLPPTSNALPQTTDTEIQALLMAQTLLEEKPFDAKARDVRAAAMRWIIDTDKVSVTICGNLFDDLDDNYVHASDIVVQYAIGMAAFKLTKPARVADESAAQLAGIESALTSYRAMVKERPGVKTTFLESLLAKQAAGELADFVKKNNCVKLETA
ncbi:MAG TPA: hypothetical protein VFY29_20720 [Terriglobia bacterium]|nr:hypothetical protein [Terriglobia bacterium]